MKAGSKDALQSATEHAAAFEGEPKGSAPSAAAAKPWLRRLKMITGAAALVASVSSVQAADYPIRPITMVVPQAAGGASDIVARLLAQKLGEQLGGKIVIDNRPGAGGNIGTQLVAKSPKDGYTLMATISSTQAINPSLYKNVGFDPVADFAPIALVGFLPNVLVVHPSFPAKTFKEFIEVVKARPRHYTYASSGNGTMNHLLGEMLVGYGGVQLVHVPYKGIAPALTDVLSGQVPMAFATPTAVLQHVKTGRLVALGVSSAERTASMPEVPAIAETLPGFAGTIWIGIYAPLGIPADVELRLQSSVKAVLQAPDVRQRLIALGVDATEATPAQMAQLLIDDLARWKKIVKDSGATVD